MNAQKNETGVPIIVETGYTITEAANLVLNVTKPSGAKTTWTPTIHGTTQLKYVNVSEDFNEDGWYTIYPTLTVSSKNRIGAPTRFLVKDPANPDKNYTI